MISRMSRMVQTTLSTFVRRQTDARPSTSHEPDGDVEVIEDEEAAELSQMQSVSMMQPFCKTCILL